MRHAYKFLELHVQIMCFINVKFLGMMHKKSNANEHSRNEQVWRDPIPAKLAVSVLLFEEQGSAVSLSLSLNLSLSLYLSLSLSIYLSIDLLPRPLIISCLSATLEREASLAKVRKRGHGCSPHSLRIYWIVLKSPCDFERLCLQHVAYERAHKSRKIHAQHGETVPKMIPKPLQNRSWRGSGSYLGASLETGCFQDLIFDGFGSILGLPWDLIGSFWAPMFDVFLRWLLGAVFIDLGSMLAPFLNCFLTCFWNSSEMRNARKPYIVFTVV